jgi:hypothetical protein
VQKQQRLRALSHDQTVNLLLQINTLYPHIALFPPSSGPSSASKNTGTEPTATLPPVTPGATTVATTGPASESHQDHSQHQQPPQPVENHYDGYETDPPAHYPKPGNGLARTLPPEADDVPWLLDDNFDVFQQIDYRGQHHPSTGVNTNGGEGQATGGPEGLAGM